MTDLGFPIIRYESTQTPTDWGRIHGETFRQAIVELAEIRRQVMHEKNPKLTSDHIARLAVEQWDATKNYDATLFEELEGIRESSGLSISQIVILNNYTDFRDIQVHNQGCSVVLVNHDQHSLAGQTWDMHGSAKLYMCCLEVPQIGYERPSVLFSLVGCPGMMGYHPRGSVVGLSNIYTNGAAAGALWPCVIRKTLEQPTIDTMGQHLAAAPVTSGHAYLLADHTRAEMWEVMPQLAERISHLDADQSGFLFRTNHCLGDRAKTRETKISDTSTTYIRYNLIEKKIVNVKTDDDVYDLLNDRENHPRSIFSNYLTDSIDPSITCGGAVGDLKTGKVRMWRGDEQYDDNFVCHTFDVGSIH